MSTTVQSERLRFMDALVTIPVAHADGKDGVWSLRRPRPSATRRPSTSTGTRTSCSMSSRASCGSTSGGVTSSSAPAKPRSRRGCAPQLPRGVGRRRALARRHHEGRLRAGRPQRQPPGGARRVPRFVGPADTGAGRRAGRGVQRMQHRSRRAAASLTAARSRRRWRRQEPCGEDADEQQRLGDEHAGSFRR
jgi:hypothetical protein